LIFVPARHVDPRRTLIIVAPSRAEVPGCFLNVAEAPDLRLALLSQMQRLRGAVYSEDGALTLADLLPDGRHWQLVDDKSWHVLAIDKDGLVSGGVRYHETTNRIAFSQLGLARSAIAQCDVWGRKLRAAIEDDLCLARGRDVPYVELGGWALAKELRCSTEGLRMALAMYGLAQNLGGVIGVTTATRRHNSSSILRRIGGRSLVAEGVELPGYYDPQYNCEMEILRFDSTEPNPRYQAWIDDIRAHLLTAPVIQSKFHPADGKPPMRPISLTGVEQKRLFQ
jgi:hypothetical protein